MSPKIKRILYATDRSKNSSYAFLHAIDMAKKYGAEIVVLHVMESIPGYAESHAVFDDEELPESRSDEAIEAMKRYLEEFCEKAHSHTGIPCAELVAKILVKVGHPPEEILNTADEEACDVIVMGSHGKGFLSHTFLGSVSTAILHRTRKPVFIVPLPSGSVAFDWDNVK